MNRQLTIVRTAADAGGINAAKFQFKIGDLGTGIKNSVMWSKIHVNCCEHMFKQLLKWERS